MDLKFRAPSVCNCTSTPHVSCRLNLRVCRCENNISLYLWGTLDSRFISALRFCFLCLFLDQLYICFLCLFFYISFLFLLFCVIPQLGAKIICTFSYNRLTLPSYYYSRIFTLVLLLPYFYPLLVWWGGEGLNLNLSIEECQFLPEFFSIFSQLPSYHNPRIICTWFLFLRF